MQPFPEKHIQESTHYHLQLHKLLLLLLPFYGPSSVTTRVSR